MLLGKNAHPSAYPQNILCYTNQKDIPEPANKKSLKPLFRTVNYIQYMANFITNIIIVTASVCVVNEKDNKVCWI